MSEYSDYPKRELRIVIARRVGVSENRYDTELSKTAMNSLVAYLTGELPVKPYKIFDDDAPTKLDMKEIVAGECSLVEWLDRLGDWEDGYVATRPRFTRGELVDIVANMEVRGDQREWVSG